MSVQSSAWNLASAPSKRRRELFANLLRTRCVSDCADVLSAEGEELCTIANSLREKDLKLLTADKEGFFVLLTEGQFSEKASNILAIKVHSLVGQLKEVKERAKCLLQEMNLERLRKSLTKAEGLRLETFFSMKTHKADQPFRTIVSEKGTWQLVVSAYLQNELEE